MKKKLFVARYYILIFFMSLLTACSVGDSVRVVHMSKIASKGLLSASDSLPGIAGNPADIMVFDSLLLVLDEELTTFAVDEKNGIIYGVTNSDGTKEPELVSFAIPHD